MVSQEILTKLRHVGNAGNCYSILQSFLCDTHRPIVWGGKERERKEGKGRKRRMAIEIQRNTGHQPGFLKIGLYL